MKNLADRIARWSPQLVCATPAVLFVVVSVIGLHKFPYSGNDETYPASTALTLMNSGRFARDMTAGSLGTEVFDAYPPLWMFLLAGVYELFGIGIWTTRIPSVLVAGLAVGFLAAAVYTLSRSKLQALAAGTLYALDPLLLQRSRIGRSEPLALMFLTGAMWALARSARWGWWLAGVCFVLSAMSYQFAAVSACAIALGLLVVREFRRVAWLSFGGATGLGLWFAWYAGRWSYLKLQVLDTGRSYAEPVLVAMAHEYQRYAALIITKSPTLIPVLLGTALVAHGVFRSRTDGVTRALSVALPATLVVFAAVGMKAAHYYFLFACPFVYVVLCQAVFGEPSVQTKFARGLAILSAAGGVAVLAGISYKLVRENDCRDLRRFDAAVFPLIAPTIAAGRLVVGPTSLFFPTVMHGGQYRVAFSPYGPHMETLLQGFLDNPTSLANAGILALDVAGDQLVPRFPALRRELEQRVQVGQLVDTCGPSLFSLTFYERPERLASPTRAQP